MTEPNTNYPCQHNGDGYLTTTDTHYGNYEVWVCGDCSKEVPIDELPDSMIEPYE
jgi:hypothetical protein